MEKICNRSSDRSTPSGRQSLLWKLRVAEMQPSGRGPIQERISAHLESRFHSYPSRRSQLPSGRRLEKIVSDSI
jgi:hypothetical protein